MYELRRLTILFLLGVVTVTPLGYLICLAIGHPERLSPIAVISAGASFVVCDLLERYFPLSRNR
jgi:uncharacterized PurR-regulated membrane protein YhhQ (DUF165 family)